MRPPRPTARPLAVLATAASLAAAWVLVTVPATADYAHEEPLLDTTEDLLGQPLRYPEGQARIRSSIITVPPGETTGWHQHDVPLYGYVLAGELTLDYGQHGTHTFGAGEALIEAVGVWHRGTSTGEEPLEILVVFISSTAAEEFIPRPE